MFGQKIYNMIKYLEWIVLGLVVSLGRVLTTNSFGAWWKKFMVDTSKFLLTVPRLLERAIFFLADFFYPVAVEELPLVSLKMNRHPIAR